MASEYDALLEEEEKPPPPPPPQKESPYDALLTEPAKQEPRQEPPSLSNVAAMKSGVAEMSPEARAAAQQVVQAIPQAISGAQQAQMAVMTGGGSLLAEALTPEPIKEFMRTPLVSPENVDIARRALQYPLHTVLFGSPPEERGALGTAGRFTTEQIAGLTTPENIVAVVGTEGLGAAEKILEKRAPSLMETLFGRRTPTVTPATEAAATESVVRPPPVPGEFDRRLLVQPERRFTLVPEPKPEIAPVQPLEQQIAELPGARVRITPEGEVPLPERETVRTGIQAETQRIGEPNASEITSAESVPQPEVRTPVGEGTPLRQQGETSEARQGPEIQPETKAEVAPFTEPTSPTEKPPIQVSGEQPHVSRIANRFVDERVATGELGEVEPGTGFSTRELVQRGTRMSPEEINQHVSDLMQKTGDPIKQAQAVRAEEARLSQRSAELSRAAEENPNNLQAKLDADNAFKDVTDFHNGPVAQLKQTFHATGMGLQGEIPVDLGSFNGLRQKWLQDTGSTPPTRIEGTLRKTARQVREAENGANGATQRLSQEIEKAAVRRKLPSVEEVKTNIQGRMKVEPCIV